MLTERFHKLRKEQLDAIFSKQNLTKVWRKIVIDQLRKTDILDIFDHYDFTYNIEDRASLIRSDVLNGNYQCSAALIYRVEKKYGICRHLIIPQPTDALVLQVITETLSGEIIKKQPSENAFYSQDKHNVGKPHEIDEYGMNWRDLWKKMQKKIYGFSEEKELIVVTDLSNFYDSIDINELRKRITGYVDDKEVLLDLLFKIIEKISWLPDYLPYSGRGLPTTNLEGVRLLAHSFLFELDAVLKQKSKNSFTRWMDDIVIGIDSREEAIETLSSASDILKSRGLALNLSKTSIYNSKEAEFNFQIEENQYLDSIVFSGLNEESKGKLVKELKEKFKQHLKTNYTAKYFDKITKRYITAFGRLNSTVILSEVDKLYKDTPSIRQNIITYLLQLGYKKNTSDTVLKIVTGLSIYDDISLFEICKLVTSWDVKLNTKGAEFLKNFISKLNRFSGGNQNPFDFYCVLWVKAKYEHPEKLYNFIINYESLWNRKPFLRRQVTAIMARLLPFKEDKVRTFLEKQISTGDSQIVSMANHILKFSSAKTFEGKVHMYLFPEHKAKNYSLQKFLVLCSVLNSHKGTSREQMQKKITNYISDSYYRKWLELQYDIK
jgi:hypothetical protein